MRSLLSIIMLSASISLSATDIWVSPSGSDSGDGSKNSPKATLNAALRQARELRRLNDPGIKEGITIHLEKGVHNVYEPLFVRPEDSGTSASPTVILGEDGASISGGVQITGWKKQGKLWVADVPSFNGRPLDFRQLWVNGSKAVRARDVEDFEKMYRIRSVDNENRILWVPAEAVKKIMKAPYAEMVLHEMWCVANLRIKSVEIQGDSAGVRFHDPESRIQFEHPWPRPMVTTDGHNSAFYLTNAKELLDRPGEWYHDINTRKLYYYPREGEDMRSAEAVVPAVERRPALRHLDDPGDGPVQEVPVVGHGDHRPGEGVQVVLQNGQGLDVQVVGGLIQQQHIGGGGQHGEEIEPPLFPAGQLADGGPLFLRREEKLLQQLGGREQKPLAGQAARKGDGVLFRHANVKETVRVGFLEEVEAGTCINAPLSPACE